MEPSIQDIQELRSLFTQKVQDEKDFHPKDIYRVNNDDAWLRRFLLHHDLEIRDALNMLIETCEWRKSFKVNEINDQTINREYLEEGSIFVHGRDKDGKSLFIFKCSKHVKGQKDFEELKRCVVYWMERVERQDKGDQITIFFDMTDTGLANMDMEYTKYLINLCKQYYPYFLNYILIFEMPWVLNAAFKIIKTWLPTKAVQKIKFVNKNTLKDYVDSVNALKSWGGLDAYEFSFEPETQNENNKSDENKKKVHFADGSPTLVESHSDDSWEIRNDVFVPSTRVRVTPQDAISFVQEGIEVIGSFTVQNVTAEPVTYKVKTTSPKKFRVRPSCGMLAAYEKVTVSIVLITGYTDANILRDKFLVMNIPLDHTDYTANDLNENWRRVDSSTVEEHRLRCRVASLQQAHNGAPGVGLSAGLTPSPSAELEQKMSQLLISMNHVSETCYKMENEVKTLRRILLFIITIICLATCIIFIFYDTDLIKTDKCFTKESTTSSFLQHDEN